MELLTLPVPANSADVGEKAWLSTEFAESGGGVGHAWLPCLKPPQRSTANKTSTVTYSTGAEDPRGKLQRTATHCNTLHHIATHCQHDQFSDLVQQVPRIMNLLHAATSCNTLQHTATHCNTLQHTATRCQHDQYSDLVYRCRIPTT